MVKGVDVYLGGGCFLEQGCLPKVIQHVLQLLQVIILHIILLPFQSDVHGNISKLI